MDPGGSGGPPDPERNAVNRPALTLRTLLSRVDLRSRRGRLSLTVLCAVLLCVGVVLVVTALNHQTHAPQPSAAAGIAETPRSALTGSSSSRTPAPAGTAHHATKRRTTAPPLPVPHGHGADPVQITIPALGVHADIMLLGLAADRTVQTPPLTNVAEAGWYKYSPTPGRLGPSIILGHVDSAVAGKGVFFDLGAMRQGESISVLRADHVEATFAVTRVVEYPKSAFPTSTVYGNTPDAELRLITCGGRFNPSARSYVDNIVVFATLTGLKTHR